MRRVILVMLGLLLLVGVLYVWRPAERRAEAPAKPVAAPVAKASPAPAAAVAVAAATTNRLAVSVPETGRSVASTNREFFRLTNTKKTLAQMTTSPHAILLENALVDTAAGLTLNIPKQLRSEGDPGAYVVQARGLVNNAFRAAIAAAGAEIVSYIPNNAYLVQATAGGANALSANAQVQAVLPYEPYFKVQSSLLGLATKQEPLPAGQVLTLGLYDKGAAATVTAIQKMGGKIIATDRSPFGPVVRVLPPADWLALAQLSGVQRVEPATRRQLANDLARVTMGISPDTVTNVNWLGLSGSNVLVEVNDTGIDASHPDFGLTVDPSATTAANSRVIGYTNSSLVDIDGHGTHVAGVIAGNGSKSSSVTNIPQGSVTNADFRGKAPAARLFSFGFLGANDTNVFYSDQVLQSIPALTNALISNNSWVNGGANEYDLSAASYDAAVRDSLPGVTGPQPVLYVFPAGNDGNGNDAGSGGVADTIVSPGTAKNVITVGALEQYRSITNTYIPRNTTNEVAAWQGETDSSTQVAGYSARGNVGIQTEGPYGRFKPDVVAPGTFVISTRPSMWDQAAYYNPTNYTFDASNSGNAVDTNFFNVFSLPLPANAVGVVLQVVANNQSPVPFPQLKFNFSVASTPIDPSNSGTYDFSLTTNTVSIPPDGGGGYIQQAVAAGGLNFVISDTTNFPVSYDLVTEIITTNENGNYLTVVSNLNDTIGPWYYYETGTSIAAPAASGALALIQDFFTNTLHSTPSPALLKAMLINGARLTDNYEFAVTNDINYEGWGQINVPNSVPLALTNLTGGVSNTTPMFLLDQSPTNALATGDSRTYLVKVPSAEAAAQFLRVTLVWTDPPGNPAAGIKLVNNLDLIVTNLDTGAVYYGNDLGFATTPYSVEVSSNSLPDSINNVENIWLQPPLGTNYSVTVIGRNVTANAVTLEQTNVVQDFALVISCGDSNNVNGITVTPAPSPLFSASTNLPTVTFISSYTNGIYFNQLAGANAPWLSTNDVYIDPTSLYGTNADLFVGLTNQWHFYVITNTTSYTNAAFIIFLPNTLSTPRIGVFSDSTGNSTRPEADLNLFVAAGSSPGIGDPNAGLLTNLDLTVISNCVYNLNGDQSSLARGGTKFIAYSNSTPNQVYYIGVQCQDQMAAEYGFLAVFSEGPFSLLNPDGSQTVNGLLLPTAIPDGNNTHPGLAYVFGLALYPMQVRDVTVTNTITHENYGDLAGALTHNSTSVILNNHDGITDPVVNYTTIYNDAGQVGTTKTDGPGSLLDFRRKEAIGPWFLTEQDNASGNVGSVTGFTMNIQPHTNLNNALITVTLPPHSWYRDYVDVPVGYTNILVVATNLPPTSVPPIQLYLNYNAQPDFNNYLVRADLTNAPAGFPPYPDPNSYSGNSISYGPPVNPGTYWVGLYNPDNVSHDVVIGVFLGFDSSAINKVNWDSKGNLPLIDDAVLDDSIFVTNTDTIQGISVGLRVDHQRISDLVFTLISPDGTRYLLMENRGGQSTNGAGMSMVATNVTAMTTNVTMLVTNISVASSSLSTATPGEYTSSSTLGDWTVAANQVSVVKDPANAYAGSNLLALANGALSYTLPAGITNGTYSLSFTYRGPKIAGWWRGEANANDSIYGNAGTVSGSGYTSGEVGQAFQFNYSSFGNRIEIPDSINYQLTNAFSIDGWFKPTGSGHGGEILWRGDCRPGYDPYSFQYNSDGTLGFYISDTSGNVAGVSTPSSLVVNQWYYVAATYDNGAMSIYVNGSLVAQTNTTLHPIGVLTGTEPCLGIGNVGTACWHDVAMQGNLDEVSLYARVLSASEIKAIYNANTAGKYDPVEFGISAPLSLSEAKATISGVSTNVLFGDNNNWQTYSVSGLIPTNGTTIAIAGLEPGLLLGSVVMSNITVSLTNATLTYLVTNVVTNSTYLTFTEDTNLTTTPIKYAVPPFVMTNNSLAVIVGSNVLANFETATAGTYLAVTNVAGWPVISNQLSVVSDSINAANGSNYMALANGAISNSIATVPGQKYAVSINSRGPGIVGWWRAESNTVDSIYGNNGYLTNGAAYGLGEVGTAFNFNGVNQAVEIPQTPNLNLTNQVTLEFWMKPAAGNTMNSFQGLLTSQNYLISIDVGNPNLGVYGVDFSINDGGTYYQTANVNGGGARVTAGVWHHVVGTYDGYKLQLYIDGQPAGNPRVHTGHISPMSANRYVSIGSEDGRGIAGRNFSGLIDEASIYNRALSASEIKAIYQAGINGKFDPAIFSTSPAQSLAEASVSIPGITGSLMYGNNTNWQQQFITFTAADTTTPLVISGIKPGMLLDSVATADLGSNAVPDMSYQPEQSLDPLIGTSAYGLWTLEVLDNRAGATNNANLVSWQLNFTFANTNFTLATITNGFPGTNEIPGGATQWYLVDVPTNADFATNILKFATLPANFWWSTNEPPTITNIPPDTELLAGSTGGSVVLSTNGSPINLPTAFIQPGGHYYLGVQNPNVAKLTAAVDVRFHLLLFTPTVITEPATNIVTGSATLQALVTPNSTNTTVYFKYGPDTNLLSGPSASVQLTSNYATPQWVTNDITGLTPPGSIWYFRAVGTNIYGTNYGAILTFTNPYAVPPPYAYTAPATLVNGNSAQLNGFATPNGYDAMAWFEWGQSTAYGTRTPPVDVGTNFNVVFVYTNVLGLTTNVPIHYRLVVSNEVGVTYGFDQIFAQGSVVTWGSDFAGQTIPVPSGLTNLVAGVGAGYDFSLALNFDGTVVAWGDDASGQTNVPAGLNNAVAVAGGNAHGLALRSDRTVTVWGDDTYNQTNAPANLTNAVAAASGAYHCLALRDDGNPVAWGRDNNNQTNIPVGLSNVVAVAAGYAHSLALKNDGTVVAWGNNASGQTNVPAGLTNVVAIAAGHDDSLALRRDGTVVAWGSNATGQTNVPTSLTNVTAITAGYYHCQALKGDGTVWFWGDSSSGQLNGYQGGFTNVNNPGILTNVFAISGGGFHTLSVQAFYDLNVTNTPPYWTNGLNGTTVTMDELTVTNINNAARDSNSPPQLVFYSLLNPPAFASIDSFSGVITLQPQEVDGPTNVVITTVATDNGYPPLSNTNSFTLVVNEVNTPPFWTNGVPASTNYTIGVGQLLPVTNTATDSDIPTNALFYSVTVSPTNSAPAIDANGIITWTPSLAGVFTLTTIVVDFNPWDAINPDLFATNYLTVTVTNVTPPLVNTNFSITSIVYTNIGGSNGFLLTWFAPSNDLFQVQWTDVLAPANWQTFTNPLFVSYNTNFFTSPTNTQFNFFDDGSQSDGFSPTRFYRLLLLQATNTLTLPVQTNFTAGAAAMVIVTNTATDSRSGAVLTYSLVNPPAGAGIDTNGVITWTNAGPAGLAARFNTLVTDDSLPPVSATNLFTVFVTPLPSITNVLVTATNVTLTWSAPTNDAFNVRWATNLTPPVAWNVFPNTITSPVTGLFSFMDTNAPALMKFYQLILLP